MERPAINRMDLRFVSYFVVKPFLRIRTTLTNGEAMTIKTITLYTTRGEFNITPSKNSIKDDDSIKEYLDQWGKVLSEGSFVWFWTGSSYVCLNEKILKDGVYVQIEVEGKYENASGC